MPVYRSAQGKAIDMSQIVAKNEKVRAVGNMNVNARGDILDSHNRVIKDNTKRVKAQYQNVVKKKTDQNTPTQQNEVKKPLPKLEELSDSEKELFEDLDNEEVKK